MGTDELLGKPPGGLPPYMGYIGMCDPKGYGFSAVLIINRVSILADLAILVINRVWFLHSSLIWVCFKEATFSSLSKRKSTKALHKLCFR